MAPLTSTLVASSTPQPSQEPRKMTMSPADITMHDLIANQLEAFGWTKSDGAAMATKRYDTAAGQREAQLYFSVHWRSQEHTSELKSLMRISYAVFCLKKKKTN